MKRFLAALVLAAGCASPGGSSGPGPETERALALQLPFDTRALKPGDWVMYTVRTRGVSGTEHVKWSVVGREGTSLWIENKMDLPPRGVIYKTKYDASGNPVEIWVGEPGTRQPAKVYPSPRAGAKPPALRDPSAAKAALKEAREAVTVNGKPFACTRVTSTLTYPGGRESTLTNWCSTQVPFPLVTGGRNYGGLVKRTVGRVTMELVGSGRGATLRPELLIPE